MNSRRIYVLSTDSNVPCGGIKQLYRHVDVLNGNGFNASVVHAEKGFRCTWFENKTQVSCLAKTSLRSCDYLVVPEIYGELFCSGKATGGLVKELKDFISRSANTVVFNQNCYLSFNGYSTAKDEVNPFWRAASVKATMVVSEDSRAYMEYVFPETKVFRIHNSADPRLFCYQHEKKKQICFMPRKLKDDLTQVVNILKARDALGDFELVPIENKSERQVAAIMRESLIFLSLSYQEGCAIPPIEAMMCGCLVIGYDGRGGREYFGDDVSYRIDGGDIIGYARTVEDVINRCRQNHSSVDAMRRRASEYAAKTYSPEKETQDILHVWATIAGHE